MYMAYMYHAYLSTLTHIYATQDAEAIGHDMSLLIWPPILPPNSATVLPETHSSDQWSLRCCGQDDLVINI